MNISGAWKRGNVHDWVRRLQWVLVDFLYGFRFDLGVYPCKDMGFIMVQSAWASNIDNSLGSETR